MPNEQIKVPVFAASEILTAANMNLSAGTGVPVFATTVTRDAAFGGAGEKVLAEGQLCYLSDSNIVQYYDGAAWATVGPAPSGLTLVSATTIGSAVSSVTVSSAFSSTYENYFVTVSGGVTSAACRFLLTLGSTSTGYYYAGTATTFAGTNSVIAGSNVASFAYTGGGNTSNISSNFYLYSPNLAKNTFYSTVSTGISTGDSAIPQGGFLNDTTQYTAFTLTPNTGTITGGTIRVYGLAKS
jgi:hypothetical protein